jgi:hypothetical protein
MPLYSLMLLGAALAPAAEEHANPLYQDLLRNGVAVSATAKVPLPPPTMPDGLDAKGQMEVLKKLAGEDYSLEELLRNSVVAPHILRLRDVKPSDPNAPARGLDVWFVAYGDLKTATNKEFLDGLLSSRKDGQGKDLTPAELARRKLTAGKNESYGRVTFDVLERVEVSATGHSFQSNTADSVVTATRLDPRFLNDPDHPNRWRPLTKGPAGVARGPAEPYDGAAYYVKITRLAEPQGALFIEGHLIFTEPTKWFNGANLLRSKLPPVVQNDVRTARRELLKAAQR